MNFFEQHNREPGNKGVGTGTEGAVSETGSGKTLQNKEENNEEIKRVEQIISNTAAMANRAYENSLEFNYYGDPTKYGTSAAETPSPSETKESENNKGVETGTEGGDLQGSDLSREGAFMPKSMDVASKLAEEVDELHADLNGDERLSKRKIRKIREAIRDFELRKDMALGSALTYKSVEKSREAIASNDTSELIKVARLSREAVATVREAVEAELNAERMKNEQGKALNRMVKGFADRYDFERKEKQRKPDVGKHEYKLRGGQEGLYWKLLDRNSDKYKFIFSDLMVTTGRKEQYAEIIGSKSLEYESPKLNNDGNIEFGASWKDKNGKARNIHFIITGSSGKKPRFWESFDPRHNHLVEIEIIESGTEAAEGKTETSGDREESPAMETTRNNYPASAEFIDSFRNCADIDEGALQDISNLENLLRDKKDDEARVLVGKIIEGFEEGLKDTSLAPEERKNIRDLLQKAKKAAFELKKAPDEKKGQTEKKDAGHPDILKISELGVGDVAIVTREVNGKEKKYIYRRGSDRKVYRKIEQKDGTYSEEVPVKEDYEARRGKWVTDIQIIRGGGEGQGAPGGEKEAERGDGSVPNETKKAEDTSEAAEKNLSEAIDAGDVKQIAKIMESGLVSEGFLKDKKIQFKVKAAIEIKIAEDNFKDAVYLQEKLGVSKNYFKEKEVRELIEKRIVAGQKDGNLIRKMFGIEEMQNENVGAVDRLDGEKIKEGE